MYSWQKSQNLIIGGNGLLSKRPTRYSPKKWPTYFKVARGSKVKAVNGKWYLDFSEFSIGCNLFGYSPSHLRLLPAKYIFSSPLATLNSTYEPKLAEELNKSLNENRVWKFTRGGGESLSLSTRFARMIAKNKGPILVTGYHGWHDWYLAANITPNSLDKLLIPGLSPYGVPKELNGTVRACNLDELASKIKEISPSIVVYEGSRSEKLSKESIKVLKDFQKKGGLLIADEVTSAFRSEYLTFSKEYGISPDLLILGKSLGSGYAISAVGCLNEGSNLNKLSQIFASSTFWTEEIGLKAGYLTVQYFNKNKKSILRKLHKSTSAIRDAILSAAKSFKFNVEMNDHPTMIYTKFSYKDFEFNLIKSIICAEMLERNILFSNVIYPTLSQKEHQIKKFKRAIFSSLKSTQNILDNNSPQNLIDSYGIIEEGFARLTR